MKKCLVIRRDNIGDLVCTTPLLALIRQHYPEVQLDVLVNSYNAAVVKNHPDIDQVYVYTKAKHRAQGVSVLSVHWQRLKLLWKLRQQKYDVVFLAQIPVSKRLMKLVRFLKPAKTVFYTEGQAINTEGMAGLTLHDLQQPEAVMIAKMLEALGITVDAVPPCRIAVTKNDKNLLQKQPWYQAARPTIGIHISARKPSQRWEIEQYVALINKLPAQFVLFWSPGAEDSPLHPGDDHKAAALLAQLPEGVPVLPYPTQTLEELMAGIALCDQMICSDGGAMHIAAGMGKPIVCFFGQSSAERWHPWGVPYVLLQKPSRQVSDVGVDEVEAAFFQLQKDIVHA